MSRQNELNLYIRRVQERLRLGAWVRGAAILMAAALFTTLVLVVILNKYAFPGRGMTGARIGLIAVLALTGAFAVAWPVMRLNRRRSVATAEAASPELEQRLTTFSEKEKLGNDPFIELLAADTLKRTEEVAPERLVPSGRLLGLAGAGVGCLAVLVWMIAAGPGYVGYGASLLWTGARHDVAPLYDIKVTPGDIAVRRHSDQLITAQVIGLKPDKVRLFAKYEGAGSDKADWEPVLMQVMPARAAVAPTAEGKAVGGGNYQFVFAGLPESVEYYVEAGPLTSKHYKVRVVDLPTVKQIQVTYHYPAWTGLKQVSEEHGGDLRAIEGTEAEIQVMMDRPLREGVLALDGGQQVKMTGGEGNRYHGVIKMEKDGAYHVAALDEGQQVRLSEDYFIATNKAMPPEIRIDRPGGDYRASPIEEVTIAVNAADEFGLNQVELHYSVNGGAEQKVNVLKAAGAKESDGTMTLRLEDYKLVPGDLVSLYATARDGHSEAKTEMSFIQAEPFEREFSQSQQSGGGGGGGGGGGQQGNQTDISKREKELIAATWKQVNAEEQKDKEKDKAAAAKEATDAGAFLSGVQTKLREQVLALSGRMQSRDLSTANEEFTGFEKDMQAAAAAMIPSADKLKGMQWKDAISMEEKALQNLLRAEATFRQIQVAFGQRGGGGGGGGSAGRDLASLFDLELDTEKNQYETAQTASPAEQKQKEVDDALAKLDALARRQEELAQKPQNGAQSFEQRWQQEMLRREAERLEKQMAQMAENGQQGQQGGQQGQQGSQGQQSGQQGGQQSGGQSSGQAGGQSGSQGSQGGQQSASSRQQQGQQQGQNGKTDPRVTQALNRLRQADDAMKQGTAGSQQQSTEAAKRAAEALREAQSLLSGTQQQQASGQLDSLARDADKIGKEEKAQADRIRTLAQPGARGQDGSGSTGITQEQYSAKIAEANKLAEERQGLSDELSQLERGMRNAERSLAPNQPGAASKLRDALNGMDQSDLGNRVQRTADWLRQGWDPNTNGTEAGIASDLQKLNEQLRGAQQAMGGAGKPGQGRGMPGQGKDQGDQTAALDHVDRLRSELQSLSAQGRQGQGGQQGQQQGRGQGQPGLGQPGQGGQQGQGQQAGQGRQQGQGQGQQAGQQGQGGQRGQGQQQGQGQGGQQQGQGGQRGGGQQNAQQGGGGGGQRGGVRQGDIGGGYVGGDLADGRLRGGGGTDANLNLDTGGQGFDQSGKRVVDGPQNRDTGAGITQREQAYRDGMSELNKLRSMTKDDPAAAKEIADLVKQMQQLDPSRFVGNPAMVEELHSQVLTEVDKLELQLRRSADDQGSEVRTSKPTAVPAGYEDAVADYYRRLSKGK